MSKKNIVVVDGIAVQPVSAAERERLDKRIKMRHEKLRKRYPEVHGKKVDWISHGEEEGCMFVSIRFTDGKSFFLQYSPTLQLDTVEFSDMKTGDDEVLRTYYLRRDM